MFCTTCGAEISEGTSFCTNCGEKVNVDSNPDPVTTPTSVTPSNVTPPDSSSSHLTPPRPLSPPPSSPQQQPQKNKTVIIYFSVLLILVLGAGGIKLYLNAKNPIASQTTTTASTKTKESEKVKETTRAEVQTTAKETTPVEQPVTVSVKHLNQVNLAGKTRVTMLSHTAYDSSHLVQTDKTIDNSAWSAFDGQSVTSWQDGVEGDGIGEYIGISFDGEYQVQVITLLVGNHRSDSWFAKNNVPKSLYINLGGQVFEVSLPKEKTEFAVVLSRPVAASDIRITVDAVYKGTEYSDTVIAEVGVYGN